MQFSKPAQKLVLDGKPQWMDGLSSSARNLVSVHWVNHCSQLTDDNSGVNIGVQKFKTQLAGQTEQMEV